MKTVNKSTVELIDSMGNDLTVVNAARVSFDKQSEYRTIGVQEEYDVDSRLISHYPIEVLKEEDEKLIKYLARHNHWSPFAHTGITLRVSAPIFVARQLVKHQVGGVWNEVSRRYVDDEPVFYFPKVWRKRADNVKQGSSNEQADVGNGPKLTIDSVLALYENLLKTGVAPEQARMILPQNMVTSWYWTGSLMFFHRVFRQRTDSHAQVETQEVALQIGNICAKLFPVSWKALGEKQ
mgnify:CR=1 FL=1